MAQDYNICKLKDKDVIQITIIFMKGGIIVATNKANLTISMFDFTFLFFSIRLTYTQSKPPLFIGQVLGRRRVIF